MFKYLALALATILALGVSTAFADESITNPRDPRLTAAFNSFNGAMPGCLTTVGPNVVFVNGWQVTSFAPVDAANIIETDCLIGHVRAIVNLCPACGYQSLLNRLIGYRTEYVAAVGEHATWVSVRYDDGSREMMQSGGKRFNCLVLKVCR